MVHLLMKNIYPYLLQGSTFQEFSVNILNSFMGSRSTLVNNPGSQVAVPIALNLLSVLSKSMCYRYIHAYTYDIHVYII